MIEKSTERSRDEPSNREIDYPKSRFRKLKFGNSKFGKRVSKNFSGGLLGYREAKKKYIYGASPSAAGPLDGLVAQWFGGFVAKLLSGSGKGGRGAGGSMGGGNNKMNKQTVRFLFCVRVCV